MNRLLLPVWMLLAVPLTAQADPPASASEIDRIEREYREVHDQWVIDVRSGKDDTIAPSKTFVDRCLLAAKRAAGSDAAVPYLVWVVRNATNERAAIANALETMLAEHGQSAAWSEILDVLLSTERLVGADLVDRVLARLGEETRHAEVEARVRFLRGMRRLAAALVPAQRTAALADIDAALRLTQDPELGAHVRAVLGGASATFPESEAPNRLLVPATVMRVSIDDHEAAVRMAGREGKLLLVNLSGFNCASCRAMESVVFRRPAPAELLAGGFVESRLHVDTRGNMTEERFARNLQIRDLLAGTFAMPCYVLVDPRTGRPLRTHELQGGPAAWEEGFVTFLRGETGKR